MNQSITLKMTRYEATRLLRGLTALMQISHEAQNVASESVFEHLYDALYGQIPTYDVNHPSK